MMIDAPTRSDELLARFEQARIPVLNRTAVQLTNLRRREDYVDAAQLADVVLEDPLMILKLFKWVCPQVTPKRQSQVETVTAAIVLMGIGPFFREFSDQPIVENELKANPPALTALRAAIRRAQRAGRYAYDFALARQDRAAETLFEITMLHNFIELMVWCFEPQAGLALQKVLAADPNAVEEEVQQVIFESRLRDLEISLAKRWCLSSRLLPSIGGDESNPQLRTILLSHRLARHSQSGWSNPKLTADIEEIAELIHSTPAATRRRVMDIA